MLGSEVNYLAVLVAAVASFLLGWLWYGPFFGKPWMKLMNFDKNSMKSMKLSPVTAMILGFLTYLIIAYVLAGFISILNAATIVEGMKIAFWIWLGFIATTTLGSFLWEGKSIKLYLLNNAYNLLNILVIAVILTAWK